MEKAINTISEQTLVTMLQSAKRGTYVGIVCKYDNALKNGFYAKNQNDKTDKNPFWNMDIVSEKHYVINIGAYYGNALAKVGGEFAEGYESPYNSIVKDLVFQHKENGGLYLQIMGNADKVTYYLDGQEMSDNDMAILNKYKKPFVANPNAVNDYKKIKFANIQSVSMNGTMYAISHNDGQMAMAM